MTASSPSKLSDRQLHRPCKQSANLKLLHRAIEDRDQVRRATITYWLVTLTLVFGVTLVLLATPFVLLFWLFGLWLGR